jgi:hypothetical protein
LVFGDSAYPVADTISDVNEAGGEMIAKVAPAWGRDGRYGKDDFAIDAAPTVTCPPGHTVPIRRGPTVRAAPSSARSAPPHPLIVLHAATARAMMEKFSLPHRRAGRRGDRRERSDRV